MGSFRRICYSVILLALAMGIVSVETTFLTNVNGAPTSTLAPNLARTTATISTIPKFTLTEWTVPTPSAQPYGIAVDPMSGNVWFTENAANKLARFDPTNNEFTEWNLPTPNSQPQNLFAKVVTVSVAQIFFTEFASNKIARFDPSTNNLTEWALPAGSNPAGIYVDENNVVWFTESGRDIIARLTTSTNTLTEWTLPGATLTPGTPLLKPWGIYVQLVTTPSYSNRFVWFTETLGNQIGRLEVTSNRLTLWNLRSLGSGSYQPTDLTLGVFQTLPVAIITNMSNKISVLGNDTKGGSLYQETTVPSLNSGPMGLAYDSPRNAAWFAENSVGNIASLNTTNVLAGQLFTPTYCTITPMAGSPTCSTPSTMASGNIPSTVTTIAGVSRVQNPNPSTTVSIHRGPIAGITEYSLPSIASGPTYVAVDSSGEVWFTESDVTVNRIGRFSIPYIFQLAATPNLQTINPGQATTFALNIGLLSGYPQPLQLSLLNTPTGVTAVFDPQSQNPPFTSTLPLTTTSSTPTGLFPMTVQASSGGQIQTALITLMIQTSSTSTNSGQSTSTSVITSPLGGGEITGSVYGFDLCQQLHPIGYASVTANNGQTAFVAYSSGGGYYEMYVPQGTYNVTVVETGYVTNSTSVNVSTNSSSAVNFYLEESPSSGSSTCVTESATTSTSTSAVGSTTATPSIAAVTSTLTQSVTVTLTTSQYSVSQTQSGVNPTTFVQVSSNSTISNFQFDSSKLLLNFTVSGPSGTIGYTNVVIAKSLLNGNPAVLIDNGLTPVLALSLTSNSTHYFIGFTYHHSTHQITIGGSNTVPEFQISTLPLLASVTLLISLIARKRRKEH
ncbi:MAG: hypothetical protein ACLP5V_03835 [Candidatus Bathyarchaeia archaeon]